MPPYHGCGFHCRRRCRWGGGGMGNGGRGWRGWGGGGWGCGAATPLRCGGGVHPRCGGWGGVGGCGGGGLGWVVGGVGGGVVMRPRRRCSFHCRGRHWCEWAMGNGQRATHDGVVGMVVDGVVTPPCRRAAGAVSTAAAAVGIGLGG